MLKNACVHGGQTRRVHLGGWKKQAVDLRDDLFRVKLHPAFQATPLPSKIDLRPQCPPVDDQGELGSCTSQMFSAMVEFNERIQFARAAQILPQVSITGIQQASDGSIAFQTVVSLPQPSTPIPIPPILRKLIHASRLFEYYATRLIEGTVNEDSGASIRDTIKAGVKYGVCDETLWPYDVRKYTVNPPKNVWDEATGHKIASYHAISDGDVTTIKTILASGVPYLVGFGFAVFDYMLSIEMSRSGVLPRPGPKESMQGGHAVCLCGYDSTMIMPDKSKGAFLVRNSWGPNWGLNGYYWMAENYVADPKLCNDFWVVKSAAL